VKGGETEKMDVSNVSVQTVQAAQSATPSTSIAQQAQQQGGQTTDFMTLIMQLLGGTGEESPNDLLAMLLEEGKKDAEENGVNMALQMMMEMLAANPAMGSNLQMIDPGFLAELTGSPNAPVIETIEGAEGAIQGNGLAAFLESQLQPKGQSEPVFQPLEGIIQEEMPEEAIPMTVEKQSAQAQDFFNQGANDFHTAVSQAKQELALLTPKDSAKSETRFDVDVDQLQKDVDAGRFIPNAAEVEKFPETPVSPFNVISQAREGIIEQLGSGKDEFVVRLKPEGLGEITVRLMQTGDKIALSISASNSHVARLLSSEIDQLRESLRPYNTVVQEVVDQQAYASNQDFAQNFAGSQYQQQQQYQGQQRHGISFMDFVNGGTVEEAPPAAPSRIISTGLNTYSV